jgi:hypothetical protein
VRFFEHCRLWGLPGRCSINRSGSFPIKPRAHFFSGLKERNDFCATCTSAPVLGLRPLRAPRILPEKTPPKLDSIAAIQSFDDFVNYRVDDVLYVPLVKVRVLRSDALYQLGFYHVKP